MYMTHKGGIIILHEISKKSAEICCSLNDIDDENKKEVLTYGIEAIVSSVVFLSIITAVSLAIGMIEECLCFLVVFVPVRIYAGGYHASTHPRCFAILAADLVIGAILVKLCSTIYIPFALSAGAISAIIIIKLAPIVDKNHPLSKRQIKSSRKKSIYLLIAAELLILEALFDKRGDLCISLSYGLLSAACSMLSAKIFSRREGQKDEV